MDPSAFLAGKELIQALEEHCILTCCDEDRILFRQGDNPSGVFILLSGYATLSMTSVSGEVVLSIDSASGSVLGLPAVIGHRPFSLTGVAHAGARVGFVPSDEFTDLMVKEPLLSRKVLEVLAAEVLTARQAILSK